MAAVETATLMTMPTRYRPAGRRQNRAPSAGLALALAAAMLAVVAAGAAPAPAAVRYERGVVHIVQGTRRVTLQVEIARTPEARAQGLMSRTSLPEDAGMLFVFEQDGRWGFWMKNTLIPLSIGFIDSRWRLLEILDMDVAPDPVNGPFPIYEPAQAYRYALEVNQGFFRRKGITPGARLELVVTK
ncbi:MAG: DUF192 domain-containing protein [Armatimonadota bacterium]|nr:DUF192 domain-containing protein [Armatimonadota bacterium]MDR7518155.1 DUF192 domain-containing protein [Armatimonadota bacterium]MDR7550572.1 DUF192 domain-containing protein [Armatimonadota bacterium]